MRVKQIKIAVGDRIINIFVASAAVSLLSIGLAALFDGKDIRKTSDLKDFHNRLAHVSRLHFTLFVHDLLSREQYAQSRGRDVLQRLHIKVQRRHAVKRFFDRRF